MILSPRDALLYSIATLTPEIRHRIVPIQPGLLNQVVLRRYQFNLLAKAAAAMAMGFRRVLVVLPTGGGKTVMAAEALKCAQQRDQSGRFLVHRKELIDQTSRSFSGMGLDHGFIAAGRDMDLEALTTIAGVQTLVNRLEITLPPDLVIVDEAHHSVALSWERIFAAAPDAFILGLTATPERLDGKGLESQFDVMIVGPSVEELIAWGYLSPFHYYAPSRPDIAAALSDQQAEQIMDQPDLVGNMVEHYLRLAKGQPGIVFAHSVKHSKNLVEAYAAHGVRAAHIDGDMNDKERERVDAMFRARDVDILSNCQLLGEGYDVPGVVYCGLGRRTKSLSWFRQMAGRALRPIYAAGAELDSDAHRLEAIRQGPKPQAIISDHASNVFTHGFPDDDVEWSLAGKVGRKAAGVSDDADPIRQCEDCYRVYPSRLKACPGCGAAQTPTAREIKIREGQLEKLERETLRKQEAAQRKAELKEARSYAALVDLGKQRGYPDPRSWAKAQLHVRKQYAARFRR